MLRYSASRRTVCTPSQRRAPAAPKPHPFVVRSSLLSLSCTQTDLARPYSTPVLQRTIQSLGYDMELKVKLPEDMTEEEYKMLLEKERILEEEAVNVAAEKYRKIVDMVTKVRKGAQLPSGQELLAMWFQDVVEPIRQQQEMYTKAKQQTFGTRPEKYLTLLSADKLAVIAIHNVLSLCLISPVPISKVFSAIGSSVQAQINQERLKKASVTGKALKNASIFQLNSLALRALDDPIDWSADTKTVVGSLLTNIVLKAAYIPSSLSEGNIRQPAFQHTSVFRAGHKLGVLAGTIPLKKFIANHNDIMAEMQPKHLPTLLPPKEWENYNTGGYHYLQGIIMRARGSRLQVEVLKYTEMPLIMEALNSLGATRWRINNKVLEVMETVWNEGFGIAAIPPRVGQFPVPDINDRKATREERNEFRRAVQKNRDLHSLRCDWLLKLRVAQQFNDVAFYFPHNIDFRGRAYPIPPHLNHVGSDVCRGLLLFADPQPVGESGFYWLKIHLANLYGQDKLNFDQRIEWAEQNKAAIMESADNPLGGSRWWANAEEPWQCLAACFELTAIWRSEDPANFMTSLPVQMDGSCNGLQHYAALGRDEHGAEHVNLLDSERPMDVYMGVRDVVVRHIEHDAKQGKDVAKMLLGKVERSTIKQTVMTSVYGVTMVGAREQIMKRLREKKMVPEEDAFRCAIYLAHVTLKSLGEVFSSANNIMEWLNECASLISASGNPVMWVSPLGLPVVQPYRNNSRSAFSVSTVLQNVKLVKSSDDMPVNVSRQRSAFPPNYVHSLDASHMFMTAMACHKKGITFASVHDSFWCHPNKVDAMNEIIREKFIELHSQPLLESLAESFKRRYPNIQFPDVPRRGTLDLSKVLRSKFFFD